MNVFRTVTISGGLSISRGDGLWAILAKESTGSPTVFTVDATALGIRTMHVAPFP